MYTMVLPITYTYYIYVFICTKKAAWNQSVAAEILAELEALFEKQLMDIDCDLARMVW